MARTKEEIMKRLNQIESELMEMEFCDRGYDSTKAFSLRNEATALRSELVKIEETTKEGEPS